MAAATSRGPSASSNENRMPAHRATRTASGHPSGANSHSAQPSQGRSFAARTKDLSLPPETPGLSDDMPANPPDTSIHEPNFVVHGKVTEDVFSPDSGSQPTPLSTRRSASQKHDWAYDKSPLQKLEVSLGGISKEEKRARAQEAELKLQERMAGKKVDSDTRQPTATAQDMSPKSANLERTASNRRPRNGQSATPRGHDVQVAKREEKLDSNGTRRDPEDNRPSEAPKFAPGGAQSIHYPAARPAKQPQYANDEQPAAEVRKGSVPRRSVTISNRPEAHKPSGPRGYPKGAPFSGPPRELPIPRKTSEPTGPEAQDQQPRADSGDRRTSQIQEPFSAEIGSFDPTPNEGGRSPGEDPMSVQNGVNSQPKPKRQTVSFNVPPSTSPPPSEWKNAPTVRLCASEFDFQNIDVDRSKAWWEGGRTTKGGRTTNRRKSRALPNEYQAPVQKPKTSKTSQPPMFLKCGPLLRYTGMKRTQVDGPNGSFDKETWRGSIMIVTQDSHSTYDPPPTLRLFSQPMNLLPPPPAEVRSEEGAKLAPEYVDPTAGLVKLGRDGRPLYIKPVDHTEEEMDLSFVENEGGIYEQSPSIIDNSSEGVKQPIPANRVHPTDGETVGAYKEIAGVRLYTDQERNVTFWRFNIEVDLTQTQQRIAYRLNQGPALGFWVPAQGQPMNIMFNTGNGFSPAVDSNKFCGPDPLWRDVINEHQTRPFHVMIGGGDQIFNDRVIEKSLYLQEWLKIKHMDGKYSAPFSREFRNELENFYFENYAGWFSQGLFSFANSQIPMVNMWNDHEIIEGFGSYPDVFMGTPVISGLGRIAFKYYLLFQHHSVPEETEEDEPSWLLGAHLGPYINHKSRSVFLSLGKGVSFLGLDCRTERMSNEILSEPTCDLIWDRCHREIIKGETKHLIVLMGVPIAYPRMAMLKNILNSRKSLGKAGMFGGLVNKHGGNVEIYDDHWTAKHHKDERTWLIEDLQDLAAEKSVRVTILSGDVHLAAIGQFNSNPRLDLAKDRDCRYMPNIISSAIANAPETEMVSDMLNKRNRVHHMDSNTDEEIIPIFTHDVDNKARNNKRLLPRRNWCSIREYQPGSNSGGGLLRRLSQRGHPPTKEFNMGREGRRTSMGGPFPPAETGDSYFPQPEPRPGQLLRRPTNFGRKTAKQVDQQGGDGGLEGYVNLEGGLSVTLNLEVNPKDPSGITTPYKLLVPTLLVDGSEYDPPPTQVTKGWKKWLGGRRKNEPREEDESDDGEYYESDGGEYEQEEVPSETLVPTKQQAEGDAKGLRKWFGRLK
ncbi:hypothetical protein PHISP_04134 [Aspergillus sp. HF37]|nr:hypothetical protein PHISP_04134 [Aspergillus sp. HF37]